MPKDLGAQRLLTVDETATLLKVCVRTVRRMIGDLEDPLPVIRIGASIRIHPADLERYIAAHRHG